MRQGASGVGVEAAGESACRGVRGAVTVAPDADRTSVRSAVADLLEAMTAPNGVAPDDVAALIFTLQDDLGPVNPAAAARSLGYSEVPLLMVREHGGDTRVRRCLRALMLVNSKLTQGQIRHAYLGQAASLRPDLTTGEQL